MIPVSVVVMTRNEAVNLPHCLSALGQFAERFVVDSDSADGTPAIAAAFGAVVVTFQWNGRYPKKKQWCLDALPFANDWVLFVDADERLGPALVDEIARLMAEGPAHAGYFIDGRPVFLGRRLRFGAGNRKLALFDRRRARFPEVPDLDVTAMWEVEGHYQPVIAGTVGRLRHALEHADDKPLSAWFERHNRYSDWESALRGDGRMAALIGRETGSRRWLKRLFHRLPGRPLLVFLHGYVLRLGFLDGGPGLHHALARAFYYWQVGVKMKDAERRRKGVARPR
ncbi:glycosyltransferase family 2 protein [Azospirillum soli]|uniref:glycosyltransferase family 2 protein n=1 Tax=Azospirillum soli TaxID=1304799 RepID=UPI001AE1D998|nr:glycosyltransferase family 2 protein [Azospirillum soli]MBP2316663.1 glycosyltransferase involved in cell wall biosynthesis [Azospirillum soli]